MGKELNRHFSKEETQRATSLKNKNTQKITHAGKDVRNWNFEPRWWDCRTVWPLWTSVRRPLKQLETQLPCDPAAPLLLTCSPKTESRDSDRHLYKPVFTEALFTRAESGNWCLSANERKSKSWSIHTMEYYSALREEILTCATPGVSLEHPLLSKIRYFSL